MALEWISCTINEGETACLESSLLDPSFENQTEDRLFVDFVISPAPTRTLTNYFWHCCSVKMKTNWLLS